MTNIDYIGLALELEGHANSPRIDSQTIQRAMLAAAHALRLTHESILPAASEGEKAAEYTRGRDDGCPWTPLAAIPKD